MSVEQARILVKKTTEDADFRAKLDAASSSEKRSILTEHGFGDVKLSHISEALPNSHGGELSDEDFAAVAGGGGTTTATVVISIVATASSAAIA